MKATLLAAILLVACAPEIDQDPQRAAVRAVWNPTTGVLPTPTDFVRDDEAEQLALPLDGELPAAELEFRRYLNSLDGYPLQSTINMPMSGAVNASTLGGALVAYDVTEARSLRVATPEFDLETNTVSTFAPFEDDESSLKPGHEYVFGLRGYDGGVGGAEGEPVVADAAFYFVRATEDLTDHPSAMPGESRTEKAETAVALEEVRRDLLPLYDAMAQRGIPREEIAVASKFTTTARPSVWFDPTAEKVPLPNALLVNPDTGTVDLPASEEDTEEERHLKETLSDYDGFAMSAALVLEATERVETTTINSETVRLFRIGADGSVTEEIELGYGVLDDGHTFWVRPKLAIADGADYVYVATRGIVAAGRPVEPQPISALLRSSNPLIVDGVPQVLSLDAETANRLEQARLDAKPVVDWLVANGTPRTSLSAVVPFRTASSVDWLMEMRAELYDRDVSTGVTSVVTKTPLERGIPLIMNSVETITSGKMTILDHLDPRTRRFREDGPQPNSSVDFVLTIPEGYSPGEPIPVVLFGHGLFTSRELVYMIADKLAEGGFAAFSLDLPYHGRRAVCFEDDDCQGDATCDVEFGRCEGGDIKQLESPWPDGPTFPITTGIAFIELGNILGARDHFVQAALDLMQGLRVVRGADWASATGGWTLDGDDVVYLGMSLGGILGSILSGTEPTLESFALNVPGGNFFEMIEDSPAFETTFQKALDARNLTPGTDEYFAFENGLRWLLDPVDPINTASHALDPVIYVDPVDGTEKKAPVKRVLIQMAVSDSVVPNSSTRSLSEAMSVPIREYTPAVSNHGFLFDPASLEGARGRNDVIEFFEGR